jgi:hypothetical protein
LLPFILEYFVFLSSKNVKIKIYTIIIFPVVICRCETLSLTLRDKQRLLVFERRVLRRIFGPKRDEVIGGWRNCIMRCFVELAKYNWNDQVKEDEMSKVYSTHEGEEERIQGFGGKARRKEITRKT